MRKLPSMHRPFFAPAELTNPNDVGWSIDTHVYPDTLAIQAGEQGAVLCRREDSGAHATADRWTIKGVGVYSLVTVRSKDGTPMQSADSFVPESRIMQWAADCVSVMYACGQINHATAEELHAYFAALLTETVRCIMWAWWNDNRPVAGTEAWHVFNSLSLTVVPGVRGGMPLGMKGAFADLRQPLAFALRS